MASCRVTFAAFIVLLFASFSAAHALSSPSLQTVSETLAGNVVGTADNTKILDTSSGPFPFANTFNFNGLDGSGNPAVMSYSDNANAIASYGSLGASFSSTLSNTIYNANNVKWINSPSGVPDVFFGQADADFLDTLTVHGGAGLSSIKLVLNLHGTLSAVPPGGQGTVVLWTADPVNGETSFMSIAANTQSATSINENVTSPAFAVSGGIANIGLLLQANANWGLSGKLIPDHQNVSASTDFLSTLGVVGVEGFNAFGQPVALTSAIGSSGTIYPVPEPATILLVGIGGAVLSIGRRRFRGPENF